jgi:hypothetical protein
MWIVPLLLRPRTLRYRFMLLRLLYSCISSLIERNRSEITSLRFACRWFLFHVQIKLFSWSDSYTFWTKCGIWCETTHMVEFWIALSVLWSILWILGPIYQKYVRTKWRHILGSTRFDLCPHDILTLACVLCVVTICWFGRVEESRRTSQISCGHVFHFVFEDDAL